MFYNRLGFIHTETSDFSLPIVSCMHHCQLVKGGVTLKIDYMYIVFKLMEFVYVFMSVVEPQMENHTSITIFTFFSLVHFDNMFWLKYIITGCFLGPDIKRFCLTFW